MEKEQDFIEKFSTGTYGGFILPVFFLGIAVILIIGAIKNWDWVYEADIQYLSGWSLGQLSRYVGRGYARVYGFIAGVLILTLSLILWYYVLLDFFHPIKKLVPYPSINKEIKHKKNAPQNIH